MGAVDFCLPAGGRQALGLGSGGTLRMRSPRPANEAPLFGRFPLGNGGSPCAGQRGERAFRPLPSACLSIAGPTMRHKVGPAKLSEPATPGRRRTLTAPFRLLAGRISGPPLPIPSRNQSKSILPGPLSATLMNRRRRTGKRLDSIATKLPGPYGHVPTPTTRTFWPLSNTTTLLK
jgi:hypothetical protein